MKLYRSLEDYLHQKPSQLADSLLACPHCGKEHRIPFGLVAAGDQLIGKIPLFFQHILTHSPKKVGVVFDRHIQEKIAGFVLSVLEDENVPFVLVPLGEKDQLLDADVEIGNQAAKDLEEGVDILLGVGSGVISDLTKWIATKTDLPFVILGTAASMNAYTSITATMTESKVKTSKWLHPANAVLLDPSLLCSAPQEMTCAGIGDLLARNVANADWKLSHLLRGTYFCPVPYAVMSPYQETMLQDCPALGKNDSSAMKSLADAILVSGYSMTMLDGETSPSSGSEHVISHFFDFQHAVGDLPKHFHGTQVGVGTLIMLKAYELLRKMCYEDFDLDDIERCRLSKAAIRLDHIRVFDDKARIFNQNMEKKRIADLDFRDYIKTILNRWQELWKELDPYLIDFQVVKSAMESAGCVTTLKGVDRTREQAAEALLYGSRYRSRYTVLDLLWELGLFPDMVEEILEESCVL